MKLSFAPYLFVLVFILSSFSAQALLTTTSPTLSSPLTKANIESVLGRKLKAKEKIGLWILRRKLKKAQRRNKEGFQHIQLPSDTTKCSTIFFKSGAKTQAKIIEITAEAVQFVRCGKTDTLLLSKSDIEEITLFDGIKIFQNKNYHYTYKSNKKKNNNLAIIAILLGFSAVILLAFNAYLAVALAFVAIILGISGMTASYIKYKEIPAFGAFIGMLALIINKLRKNRNEP